MRNEISDDSEAGKIGGDVELAAHDFLVGIVEEDFAVHGSLNAVIGRIGSRGLESARVHGRENEEIEAKWCPNSLVG